MRDKIKNIPIINDLAEVKSKKIGYGTKIWQYTVILERASIGHNCNICSHCFIENDVKIGNNVTIKNHNQIWDGVVIKDDVFIGPSVKFTNDALPTSKDWQKEIPKTIIHRGVSIGAGAVILPGIEIDEGATIGAGAVVTRSVKAHTTIVGSPQKTIGYKSRDNFNKNSKLNSKIFKFNKSSDKRGNLVAAESTKDVPFEIKRLFYINEVPYGYDRGSHAHIICKQFIICLKGSLDIACDDGKNSKIYSLSNNSEGLYIPELTWNVLYNFSSDCLVLVLASESYKKNDYIHSYSRFLNYTSKK
tara:strand:- start:9923 stop:10831 length:909 start_codon:yes stop_codon:yes gene_type:complete